MDREREGERAERGLCTAPETFLSRTESTGVHHGGTLYIGPWVRIYLLWYTQPTQPTRQTLVKFFLHPFASPTPNGPLFDVRGFNLPDHAPPLSCLSHPTPAANPCLPIPYPILYHIYPLYSSKGKRSTRVWFYRYRVRCISTYIFYLSFVFSGSNSNC